MLMGLRLIKFIVQSEVYLSLHDDGFQKELVTQ